MTGRYLASDRSTNGARLALERLGLALLASAAWAAAAPGAGEQEPAAKAPAARQLYWGDIHVHSRYSSDAATVGNIVRG